MSPRILKTLVLGAALPVLYVADAAHDAPFGLTLVRDAQALVGAPLTPLSVAGVARRSTRRVVAVETTAVAATAAAATTATAEQQAATAQQQAATAQQQAATAQQQAAAVATPPLGSVVSALPAGCTPVTEGGVAYQKCGTVYYRAGFQGSNLIYIVVQP
jgi:pyruvate/2-oxoglutarate dehydrogenase complex dihydrolipoamide acyltransferase (E2) component